LLRKLRNRWGGVRLITRNGNDFTSRFPLAVDAVTRLPAHSFLLDGEAIFTNEAFRDSLGDFEARLSGLSLPITKRTS
jgi:ATP-dependent DNA ligase